MRSYLNPDEQLQDLRATLVRLAEADAIDDPDLGSQVRH
jgi:hypothetical protein